MKKYILKIFYFFISIFFSYALIFFLLNFKDEKNTILSTTKMWLNMVLPSISLSYIISSYVYNYDILSHFFYKCFKNLFHFEYSKSASLYLISILIGEPSSTVLIKEAINNNEITLREGNRLMRFTSFISPLFLISMLEKRYFLFIIIGELVTSIIIANFSINTYQNETIVHKKKFFDVYFNIINNLPNILIGILICMYVINIFSSLIPNYIKPLSIILEITNGLKNLKVYEKYEYLYNYLLLSLVTLTGVAIMLQIYWIIKKTDISFKNYLKYRIIALLIGIILTSIYNLFLFKFFF